jgi:hypothetical protein
MYGSCGNKGKKWRRTAEIVLSNLAGKDWFFISLNCICRCIDVCEWRFRMFCEIHWTSGYSISCWQEAGRKWERSNKYLKEKRGTSGYRLYRGAGCLSYYLPHESNQAVSGPGTVHCLAWFTLFCKCSVQVRNSVFVVRNTRGQQTGKDVNNEKRYIITKS